MPIYEYRCGGCGLEKEFLQKVSDAPIVTCPDCGKDSMTKLISAAGFQLKGSGWYATDFKGSGSKPAAKPDAASGDAAKSESGKSDSSTSDSGTKAQACSTGCACH
ncbi:MAG: zinc ribbon domain-containing protein [Burkholderiales bacterium]|nr:zinc ribbon domain-containing protein [Burkholderiales bacterium]